ncbi:MAG: put [Myxococcaceae bacterium]|nr:put [Myxococcaceae bacterium]
MTVQHETRAPFAAQTTKADKRNAGRTEAAETPLELRTLDVEIDADLHDWVFERMSRQLGKYAAHIERMEVRFGDENGPKGGVDKVCFVHLVLSKLPPVVIEVRGETDREAFDKAAGRAERAMRHSVQRHGFHTHSKQKEKHQSMQPSNTETSGALDDVQDESLFGRHVGHGPEQLSTLADRPEKVRRDLPVDTSAPGVTASDRKAGYGHTGKRNTKLNTEGMAYKLEDSTVDRPSRKSTRGGTNHVKADANLTLRTRSATQTPKARAMRSH